MKTLLVYYSRTGTTRTVANSIACNINCDVEDLVDKTSREGLMGWLFAGRDAFRKKLTELGPLRYDPRSYDIVIIGTPVWAGSITPAVRTYLNQNKGKFKALSVFYTSGGTAQKKVVNATNDAAGIKSEGILSLKEIEVKKSQFETKVKDFVATIKKNVTYYER